MQTTLDEYQAFIAVVDAGSITAAANQLGLTVSAISRSLARLEEKLGTTLLRRTTRRLLLTDEGRMFLDRARGIGFCGLSERCDEAGAALMHAAFGLRVTLMFDLAPGEYHTNVLLAVLAGRAALVCPHALQGDVSRALHALYGPHVVTLSRAEQAAFAGNAIALTDRSVWMSRRAHHRVAEASRRQLEEGAGFTVRSVPLEAIEAGGGSLRCCVAEIF